MTPSPNNAIGGLSPDAFSSLFQAINGLRNRRALVAMLGCLVIGVLVAGVFSVLATHLGYVMAFLGGLAMFIASATGINAAGVLLMDQARGTPPRSLEAALVHGVLCIPKFILLALMLFLVAAAVFVALAIVYAVCKIPVLGPVLFVVVFPVSVVIFGLTLCGLFLGMFLALPAVWEGATITRAVAQTLAIARDRGVQSLLLLVVVGLLAGVVGLIVFGVLFSGLMPAVGMSAAILGGEGFGSMFFGSARAASATGYAIAAGMGAGLLWALAGSLVSQVYLLGLNIVYLRVTEGLDVAATEAALKARLDAAKRQAADLGQRAKHAAERARDTARPAPPRASQPAAPPPAPPPPTTSNQPRPMPLESTTPAVAKAMTCPQCLSAVGKADVFCGVCGYRLA